jgi:hypothetical protein
MDPVSIILLGLISALVINEGIKLIMKIKKNKLISECCVYRDNSDDNIN